MRPVPWQYLAWIGQILSRGGWNVLVEERRQRVLGLVSRRGYATLEALAESISVSESTIRRDVEYWGKEGMLRRTWGGAVGLGGAADLPALEDRSGAQLEEKRRIARAPAERIQDGASVLLDGGNTTL